MPVTLVAAAEKPKPQTIGYRIHLWLANRHAHSHRLDDRTRQHSLPAWAPDGRRIAAFGPDKLELLDTRGRTIRELPVASGRSYDPQPPVWSPDGRWLALLTNRNSTEDKLVVVSVGGGERRTLEDRVYGQPSWSPHASRLYFQDGAGIEAATPDGKQRRTVVQGGVRAFHGVSPDGRWVLFEGPRSKLTIASATDGSGERVLARPGRLEKAGWAPGDRGIYMLYGGSSSTLRVLTLDGKVRKPGARVGNPAGTLFHWSPTGGWIAYTRDRLFQHTVEVWISRPDGDDRRLIARFNARPPQVDVGVLEWSPNGRRLVTDPARHVGD